MPQKMITPKAILSYPALFEPKFAPDATEAKYSAVLVFPAGTDLTEMKKAVDAAGMEKFGDKWPGMVKSGKAKLPFRTDDDKGYPEGSVFFSASSKTPVGLVHNFAGLDGKPVKLTDQTQLYAGCFVRASVAFFGFEAKGNRGVAVGLNNLQKLADGPRMDGRRRAEDEFDAIETEGMDDLL